MSDRRETINEREVRKRIAEYLASAGVGKDRISLEVLYLLPPEFVDAYTALFAKALDLPGSIRPGDPNSIPIKRTRAKQLNRAKRSGVHQGFWLIRDEHAFKRKQRVDRQLRKLIRSMSDSVGEAPERRCAGCGKYQEERWVFCPYCGWNHDE